MLKKIFFLAAFLSFTFPRAGIYFDSLPVTLSNLLLFVLAGIAIIYHSVRPRLLWAPPSILLALFYFVYVLAASFRGMAQGQTLKSMIGLVTMAGYMLMLFLVPEVLKTKKDILFFTGLIILALFTTVSYGFLQVFCNLDALSIPGLTELYGSPREPVMAFKDGWIQVVAGSALSKNIMWGGGEIVPRIIGHKIFSTFHHGNLFGSHLAIFISFLLPLVLILSPRKRLLLSFLLVLAMVLVIFTNSRGAFLGLSLGLISACLFNRPRLKILFTGLGLLIVSLLLFILIICGGVFYQYKITGVDASIYLHYNFGPRYLELGQKVRQWWQAKVKNDPAGESLRYGQDIDNLANYRFTLWKEALNTIFRGRSLGEIVCGNNFKETASYKFYNFYLWMIFEIGLAGFGLFSLWLGYLLLSAGRSLAFISDQKLKAIAGGGLAGLTAGLTHNLIDAPFYYPPLLANFWLLTALVVISARADDFQPEE